MMIQAVKNMFDPGKRALVLYTFALLLIAGAVFCALQYDLGMLLDFILDKDMNPALFLVLMCTLPIMGFPFSVFLVLSGVKFGITLGIIITGLIMPIHLIVSYIISHFLLHRQLRKLLEKVGYKLPRLTGTRASHYTMIFSATPGPPYAVKNYFLALSGVPFRPYFMITWPVQLVICIPFIGVGGSAAGMNFTLSAVFAGMLLAVYLTIHWLKKKFRKSMA